MSTESLLREFVLHDVEGYKRLMKDLEEMENKPRKRYEKPKELEEGERLIRELLSRD